MSDRDERVSTALLNRLSTDKAVAARFAAMIHAARQDQIRALEAEAEMWIGEARRFEGLSIEASVKSIAASAKAIELMVTDLSTPNPPSPPAPPAA